MRMLTCANQPALCFLAAVFHRKEILLVKPSFTLSSHEGEEEGMSNALKRQ